MFLIATFDIFHNLSFCMYNCTYIQFQRKTKAKVIPLSYQVKNDYILSLLLYLVLVWACLRVVSTRRRGMLMMITTSSRLILTHNNALEYSFITKKNNVKGNLYGIIGIGNFMKKVLTVTCALMDG